MQRDWTFKAQQSTGLSNSQARVIAALIELGFSFGSVCPCLYLQVISIGEHWCFNIFNSHQKAKKNSNKKKTFACWRIKLKLVYMQIRSSFMHNRTAVRFCWSICTLASMHSNKCECQLQKSKHFWKAVS